ncbi:MAG: Maf family protein [Deltaproteobacteria bacterium]|nr:Maf family protein [Deltaproteobacteria bacterium]
MRLILASSSPRRREILGLLGIEFEVVEPQFDETLTADRSARDEVLEFALGKAQSVAREKPESIVIASDTLILLNGIKIGKPEDAVDAKRILRALAGKTHRIFTSVALLDGTGGPGLRIVEEVSVTMRAFTDAEIERYLSFNESLDKAGAYSIQGEGRALIEAIEGDYLAAVGLPLKPIAEYLGSRGISFPLNVEKLDAEKSFRNWGEF